MIRAISEKPLFLSEYPSFMVTPKFGTLGGGETSFNRWGPTLLGLGAASGDQPWPPLGLGPLSKPLGRKGGGLRAPNCLPARLVDHLAPEAGILSSVGKFQDEDRGGSTPLPFLFHFWHLFFWVMIWLPQFFPLP